MVVQGCFGGRRCGFEKHKLETRPAQFRPSQTGSQLDPVPKAALLHGESADTGLQSVGFASGSAGRFAHRSHGKP